MFFSKKFNTSFFALFTFILISCGEGPTQILQDEIESDNSYYSSHNSNFYSSSSQKNIYSSSSIINVYSSSSKINVYSSSSQKNIYSSSSKINVYSSSSRTYYSSSSEDISIYTYKTTDITINLTYFEQTSKAWDPLQGGLSDGDPRVKFKIIGICDEIHQDSATTKIANLGDDVGIWTGNISLTASISGGMDKIMICPIVSDADVLISDDYSSGYCYYIQEIGKHIEQVIYQEDYESTNFILKWNFKLTYK